MDAKGNFITVVPQDQLIAKHIACYYFHWSNDESFTNTFTFYPNYKHALTIYKDADVALNHDTSIIKTGKPGYEILYSVNTGQSFKVSLNGRFNKVGIVFNPLGINNFMRVALSEVFTAPFSTFNAFGKDFELTLDAVFDTEDISSKTQLLDHFFKQRFNGFNEPVVKKAMQEILNSSGTIKVEELSHAAGVNRKTLLRLFKKHLCASVEEYKKLVMFRNALNYSQQAGMAASLTDVALYNLYYDQAHFIKHFKSVTHQSPKELIHNLTRLGSQEAVYWHFEN